MKSEETKLPTLDDLNKGVTNDTQLPTLDELNGVAKKKYTYHSISSSIRGFCSRAYETIGSWWGNARTACMGSSEFKIDIAFGFFYFRAWNFYIGWVRKSK